MKDKKGFTLIELLAVIVILGLLMAIAIPSVTKYITESRKKTLTTTISNFVSALTNDVNDLNYTFTNSNTLYAVPIECIELERGGSNPFGRWQPASNEHWAYVLVIYNDEASSYEYGFTFKDSAGYGVYPTSIDSLDKSNMKTALDLVKPSPYMDSESAGWDEYLTYFQNNYDSSITDIKVLLGVRTGDNKNTCTILREEEYYYENILGDVNVDGQITCLDSAILRDAINSSTECINETNGRVGIGRVNIYDENRKLVFVWDNADLDNSGRIAGSDSTALIHLLKVIYNTDCEILTSVKVAWACRDGEVDADGNYTCSNGCYTK